MERKSWLLAAPGVIAIGIAAAALIVGIIALTGDGDDEAAPARDAVEATPTRAEPEATPTPAEAEATPTVDEVEAAPAGEDDGAEAPSRGEPAAYAVWLVEEALARYEAEGIEALLAHLNSDASRDGSWYVSVADAEGIIVGHFNPQVQGKALDGPIGTDVTGHNFGREILEVEETGWVSYVFTNPETGEPTRKHLWVVRRDGYLFAAGWYEDRTVRDPLHPDRIEDPAGYTVAHVEAAIARYRAQGREAAIRYASDAANNDGAWYTFIFDPTSRLSIAHPVPALVGYDLDGEASYDASGWFYVEDILRADGEGVFVRNIIGLEEDEDDPNPYFPSERTKHYYAVRYDGLIFVSGFHADLPGGEDDVWTATRVAVARALRLYDEQGIAAVIEGAEALGGVFALEADGDGFAVVAGDPAGGRAALAEAAAGFAGASPKGRWVSYVSREEDKGAEALHHAWVVRRDGYVFGASWTEPLATRADPAAYARRLVSEAVAYADAEGVEAAIARANDPAYVDGPWYFTVTDPAGALVGHYHPDVRGAPLQGPIGTDVTGHDFGRESLAVGVQGAWVSYTFLNPETGEGGRKHTWIVRRDGHLFSVGWYEAAGE